MTEWQRNPDVALPFCHDFSGRRQIAEADRDILVADHDLLENVFNDFALLGLLKFRPP
jgi:hypothetical protein